VYSLQRFSFVGAPKEGQGTQGGARATHLPQAEAAVPQEPRQVPCDHGECLHTMWPGAAAVTLGREAIQDRLQA